MWQHHDSMMPWGWGMGMWLIWLVVLVAIGFAVYAALRRPKDKEVSESGGNRESPREILDRRYAEGELTKEEYEERKEELGL